MAKKFLIADDSSFMRKMLIEILNEGGFTDIIEAENGKVALEKIESESPDITLLDIIMPEADGIEVAKQAGNKTKIITVSSAGQENTVEEAKSHGALGSVVKPFKKEKVLTEINKHL